MIHTTQEHQIGDNVELMREMPADSIDTLITSPPYYGLRDYGVDGQIGLEPTLEEYHARLMEVTAECMRVLKPTGVMFWNHGDSYNGSKIGKIDKKCSDHVKESQNDLVKIPIKTIPIKSMTMQNERLIIRMIDDQGWILRNRIIWNKPNGMPSSVRDRFSNKYEPVYMLTKNRRYWFDLDAVRVPHIKTPAEYETGAKGMRNRTNKNLAGGSHTPISGGMYTQFVNPQNPSGKNPGDVWTIPTQPHKEAHFAIFPDALVELLIKAACPAEICPVCGMARERITDKEVEFTSGSGKAGNTPKGKYEGSVQAESGTYDIRMGPKVTHHTIGWTSCDCNAKYIAGTVLDPFCGSGTVLEVCRLLNRNAIGLELNPEYEPLIKKRSMSHTPPLTAY